MQRIPVASVPGSFGSARAVVSGTLALSERRNLLSLRITDRTTSIVLVERTGLVTHTGTRCTHFSRTMVQTL